MEDNYSKAYKEVVSILELLPENIKNKVPKETLSVFYNNMDKEYEYNTDVDFETLEMLNETKAILAVLYRDFWADDDERLEILQKEKQDKEKVNNILSYGNDVEKIFDSIKEKNEKVTSLTEIPLNRNTWYEKVLKYIKNIFKKQRK